MHIYLYIRVYSNNNNNKFITENTKTAVEWLERIGWQICIYSSSVFIRGYFYSAKIKCHTFELNVQQQHKSGKLKLWKNDGFLFTADKNKINRPNAIFPLKQSYTQFRMGERHPPTHTLFTINLDICVCYVLVCSTHFTYE